MTDRAPASSGFAPLVPSYVATSETYSDHPDVALFAIEEAAIARAVAKRRAEFRAVRHCARQAMAALGHDPAPVVPGDRGAPQWPADLVGAMTHCPGYRAAAVALARDVRAIGIDAEPNVPLGPDGLAAMASPDELASFPDAATCWDRVLFSAKEATYKAWFPLTGRRLGYRDASIRFHADGTFTAHLMVAAPPIATFAGRWSVVADLVRTAVTVPA